MSELNENIFIGLSNFIKEYRKISFKSVEEYELTPGEIDVLMFLFNNEPLDTAKDITKYKGISKALVCRSVDSLTKRGLISTVVDKNDRRIIHLVLNEKASPILDKLKASKDLFSSKIIEDINPDDIETFVKVINKMLGNASKLGDE